MKKLLIYPFNKETCPIARYRHLLNGYEIISAIPEKGFGWEGKDVCELDGGELTGFRSCIQNKYCHKNQHAP